MKNLTDHTPEDLEHPFCEEEERNQIGNTAEKEPVSSEYVLIPDNPASEVGVPWESDRRVLERYHKGIFACPHYDKFFEDDDDAKIN